MAEPLYRQIAEDLRDQIESGGLVPGSQMPTEIELRDRYNASRNTIRDAIRWLTARGLVTARAGQGTFVVPKIDPIVTVLTEQSAALPGPDDTGYATMPGNDARKASVSQVKVEVQKAYRDLAAMLGVPEGDEVISRQQARYIDSMPWSLQRSFYPKELVNRGAKRLLKPDDIEIGTLAYLKQALGLEQVGYEDRIQVSPPADDEARFFKLADDGRVAVITVHRTGYAAGDHGPVPFRVTITAFPADRNQLLVQSGIVPSLNSRSGTR